MIRTILFDLDGTLLNTLEDLTDSVNYMLREYGYPERTIDEVRAFVGNGVRLLVERALPAAEKARTDECLEAFSAHYDAHKADKTRPYDGIIDMLRAVKAAGYKTAVVSNKYEAAVKALAAEEFCGQRFDRRLVLVGDDRGGQSAGGGRVLRAAGRRRGRAGGT